MIIISLFSFSSIYSTNVSGAQEIPETNNCTWTKQGKESQLAGGKPAGYLQAWPRIWTRDYREQIQLVVRTGLELGASGLQVWRSNHSANDEMNPVFWLSTWVGKVGLSCPTLAISSFFRKKGKHFGHITNPLQYNTVNLFKMES